MIDALTVVHEATVAEFDAQRDGILTGGAVALRFGKGPRAHGQAVT